MSWTWAGFWMDDPVFRYKGEPFFQSGRHQAEERFWKNYIQGDGGYRTVIRLSPVKEEVEKKVSQDKLEKKAEETDTEKEMKKKADDDVEEEDDEMSFEEYEQKRRELDALWERLRLKGVRRRRATEDKEERMSNITCASCSRCCTIAGVPATNEPVKRQEKVPVVPPRERWSSRVG